MVIYEGVKAIVNSLNDAFKSSTRWAAEKAVLSHLVEPDGSAPLAIENKLVLTVIGLDNEPSLKNYRERSRDVNGKVGIAYPGYHFSINVLMASACVNYEEGLKLLSDAVSFVQAKPLISHQNTPGLPASVDKLTMETKQVSVEHLSHIWGALGGKLLPSVLYRVRMITIAAQPAVHVPQIAGSDLDNRTVE